MENLFQNALEVATTLKWDLKPAKLDGRMNLLAHSLNAMAIAERLILAYEKFGVLKFSDTDKKTILGALFVHDFSKSDEDISKQIASGKLDDLPKRLKGRDDVKAALIKLGLDETKIEKAIDLAILMEYPGPSDITEFLSCKPANRKFDRILKLSDRLASIRGIEDARAKSIIHLAEPLEIKIHKVSVIRGISTQLLHRAVQRVAEEVGWVAVLSTPDGTVYLGRGDFKIERDVVLSHLFDELREFIDSFDSDEIGSAAFGKFTSKPIKAPEFIFISKKTAESFWDFIKSMPAISNPKDLPKNPRGGDKKNLEALEVAKPELSQKEHNYLYKLYNSMRYALMMGIAVLKEAKNADDRLYNKMVEHLMESGVDVEALIKANPRFNSPFGEVIEGVDEFMENLGGLSNRRRDEIIEETIKIFREATARAVEEVGVEPQSLKSPLQSLLSDLSVPKIEISNWEEAYKEYESGKNKGTPVCPLCGSKTSKLGISSLIGDGTESFSNMLPGGSVVGGENKVKVCDLCEFEAKLRSLIMGSGSAEIFYVIPQCTVAPNLSDYFWSEAKKKLDLGRMSGAGIPSTYEQYNWARIITDGKFEELSSKSFAEVLQNAIENACRDKRVRKAVETAIKEHYDGSIEEFRELAGLNVETIEDIIALALKGNTHVIEALGIEGVIYKRQKMGVALSNNYVVLLFDGIGRRDAAETVRLLNKLFAALIISRIFSAAVLISDLPLSVLHTTTPKGAVSIPLKLGLKDFLEPYFKDGWIPFHKVEPLMRKLAAMLLLEQIMSRFGAGAATLYELTKMSPGEILHKIVQMSDRKANLKEVLKLLKEVEN